MNYSSITFGDMANGKGMRVTLFVSGCEHHCKGCFNQKTWDKNFGKLFDSATKERIISELSKEEYTGLSILGGDPFAPYNIKVVKDFVLEVKRITKKPIYIWTGYSIDDLSEHFDFISKNIDLLITEKFIEELKDKKYYLAGSTNQKHYHYGEYIKENECKEKF